MSACSSSNGLDCSCTSSSLSPINVALPKVGNDFRFLSFDGFGNVVVNQTPNGIVVSQDVQPVGVHIGLNTISSAGIFTADPLVFNDTTITGFYNSGLYAAGVITAPVSDIYTLQCQLTCGTDQNIVPSEFARVIEVNVNGAPFDVAAKTSFSNELMAVCLATQINLAAGNQVTIAINVGGTFIPAFTIDGFLSFKKE
jgi:hypothetical protein